MNEYETYIDTIDVVEDIVDDDTKYPVIKNSKVKRCCHLSLELIKVFIDYVKLNFKKNK